MKANTFEREEIFLWQKLWELRQISKTSLSLFDNDGFIGGEFALLNRKNWKALRGAPVVAQCGGGEVVSARGRLAGFFSAPSVAGLWSGECCTIGSRGNRDKKGRKMR